MEKKTRYETAIVKGVPTNLKCIDIGRTTLYISGHFPTVARLRDEWREELIEPEVVLAELRGSSRGIDVVTFWQRLPETEPKFPYYHEYEHVAAIPISTFDKWWKSQINNKTRNMVRKAEKCGVVVSESAFSDRLVRGIVEMFNETPIRRGTRFWHYGKDFDTVKEQLSLDLETSIFITAYFEDELIGFIKLIVTDRFAMIALILDRISHRDKSPTNGMIAQAVAACASRGIPFLTYTLWRRGDHGEFQKRNGFEKFPVPRYYVPTSLAGKLALSLGLHRGVKGALPPAAYAALIDLRRRWYAMRYVQS